MYLRLAQGGDDRNSFISELQAGEAKYGASVPYWLLCSEAYRQLEEFRLQELAMNRLRDVTDVLPQAVEQASQRSSVKTRYSDEDLEYYRRLIELRAIGRPEECLAVVRQWCQELPSSIAAWFSLVDLGRELGQPSLIEEAIESLRTVEAGVGYFWRIAEVQKHLLLFREGNPSDGAVARSKIESLARQYPGQRQIRDLESLCYEVMGDEHSIGGVFDVDED